MKLNSEDLSRMASPLTDEDLAELTRLVEGQDDFATGTVWVWSPTRGVLAWLNLYEGCVAGWQIVRMPTLEGAEAYANALTSLATVACMDSQLQAKGVLQDMMAR